MWPRRTKRPKDLMRRVRITREGRYFLGITLGVGLAAISTGNNLLYILLGLLLALILVSGVMSEAALAGLHVRRRLPHRAQVGRPHLVEIEVHNQKHRIPSYAIEVEDIRANHPADKRCFFLKVSPRSTQVAAYRRTPQRRGRESHVAFRVATRFPFGLFEKSRQVSSLGELVVYPPVHPVKLPAPSAVTDIAGRTTLPRRGDDDIAGLRPYRDGDDPRLIHWKKSAAAPHLVVRDTDAAAAPDIQLQLDDTYAPAIRPDSSDQRRRWLEGFETRLRETASLAVAHLARGESLVLKTTSGRQVRAHARAGSDAVLRFLALLDPQMPNP